MPTENRSSNTVMAAVLAPFDAVADCYDSAEDDSFQPAHDIGMHKDLALTLGQFRAVRTLLTQPAPQPHPEPIAWMVGTAIWWTKEEAERDSAEVGLPVVGLGPMTGSSVPAVSIPDGYCLMPRRLTAENGAKALLLGEFKLEVTRECPECLELEEPAEGCEICDGEGEYAQRHTTPWVKINFIYGETVKGLVLQPNVAR